MKSSEMVIKFITYFFMSRANFFPQVYIEPLPCVTHSAGQWVYNSQENILGASQSL